MMFISEKNDGTLKTMCLLSIMILIISVMGSVAYGQSPPKRPVEFRGMAYLDGSPAPDGMTVSIWANSNSLKMDEFTLEYGNGFFHKLGIEWDDASTAYDEGVTYDETTLETISFRLGSLQAAETATVKASEEGETEYIDLHFTSEAEDEEEEAAPTAPAYGSGIPLECQERWECTDWKPEVCPPSGMQTRECRDSNSCGTQENKPPETRDCRKPLLGISVELIDAYIEGDSLIAEIKIINSRAQEIDVNVTYMVMDEEEDIIMRESEIIRVADEKEYTKTFNITDIDDGEYTLDIDIVYDSVHAAYARKGFSISREVSPYKGVLLPRTGDALLLIVILGLIITVIITIRRARKKED
ncbi:hypothetical protein GF345_02025 [Candidatus Woesearchaeota archaeon]|nr:hypothetical protein [Candidatus Woesearchaeota archaeon]